MEVKDLGRKLAAFQHLLEIMEDLRAQCPWDKQQTMESLRKLTIEEVYELADAVLERDAAGVKEEIGDLFLHLVFYSKIGEEQGAFDVGDALEAINAKMIRRHPHIYGDATAANAEEVSNNWEQIKLREGKKSLLAGVPQSLPALVKAYRLQEKTAKVGFEWEAVDEVWAKVTEEIGEFREAQQAGAAHEKLEDEFGDILFALVNYARFIDIDPEIALERTNRKFKRRFEYIEQHAQRPLIDMSLAEMDALWEAAKRQERAHE